MSGESKGGRRWRIDERVGEVKVDGNVCRGIIRIGGGLESQGWVRTSQAHGL
jgi:hypothetical protein